ncbi:MAG: CBS domain-containing protein [Gemmatimonadota bacterium]|nr:CBS domain-containing protein [Gemmatimonadota bacterium]
MKVADLMARDLTVVNQDITIQEAVVQLADAQVHGVPVVNRRGRLVGVLSSSDIVQTTAERTSGGDADELFDDTLVRDIMTTPPKTVAPTEDVRTAAKHMLELDVHRLFVIEGDSLVGVIAQSDIVRAVADGTI